MMTPESQKAAEHKDGQSPFDPVAFKAQLRSELLAEINKDAIGARIEIAPRPGMDGTPPDPKHALIEVRQFSSDVEKQATVVRAAEYWEHISPNAVMVAVIGNHYKPGAWQHIADMVTFTNQKGIRCALSEMQDRCFNPYDALGTMRNEAILKAQLGGYDWLCMVDADVKPDADLLYRLLGWGMPIIAPFIVEAGTGRKLHGPHWEPDQGLRPLKWCVLSMLLFRTTVFNCLPAGTMWSDAIGADEGFHFQRLAYYGHRPFIDTSSHLIVDERPHYPLASLRFSKAQYDEYWDKVQRGKLDVPDRRAIKPNDPREIDGVYNPFVQPQATPVGATLPPPTTEPAKA